MKGIKIAIVPILVATALIITALPAMAAKPLKSDGIPIGNGFPSGMHFNLNIHGKNANFDWQAVLDNPELDGYYGNSVFIPEVGQSIISYAMSKGASIMELEVEDPIATFDGDGAKVLLPYQVLPEGASEPEPANGFYVYARIRAKPNNDNGAPSRIIVSQNEVTQVSDPLDETELPLGAIVAKDVYVADGEEFVRFDAPTAKGKGGAVEITRLFQWSGWVCDPILDITLDGIINDNDVPGDATANVTSYYGVTGIQTAAWYDANWGDDTALDGVIDEIEEWLAFNADLWASGHEDAVYCVYYSDTYIWELAEIFGAVESDQPIDNYGTKLLQVRFYPMSTTTFGPEHPNK